MYDSSDSLDSARQLVHRLDFNSVTIHRQKDYSRERTLWVTFERTIRVSDNDGISCLPPSFGSFPLFEVSDYEGLPAAMKAKGGYFLAMHQREAMWLRFHAEDKFAIKIYVGGINAVSAEPIMETEETQARRYKLLSERKSVQDYVVTPDQLWLDGIASADGTVRQFVAMPFDSGYTVEAQIAGVDLIGGLQIEVTPVKEAHAHTYPRFYPSNATPVFSKPAGTPHFQIYVQGELGQTLPLIVSGLHTVNELEHFISAKSNVQPFGQRLLFRGMRLSGGTLEQNHIQPGSTIFIYKELCGGGGGPPQMGIAAGGLIKQTILKDMHDPAIWDPDNGTVFNVQILNSAMFESVTGKTAPETPITAKDYASNGFPYYEIYNEQQSGIKGDFTGVKSVTEKDLEGVPTLEKASAVAEVTQDTDNPVVLLDKAGKYSGFRPVKILESDLVKKFG